MSNKRESAIDMFYNSLNHYDKQIYELNYLQAKEMHKQEVIDARNNGRKDLRDNIIGKSDEQYYNETYNIKR